MQLTGEFMNTPFAIPPFNEDNIDKELIGKPGDAFQIFIAELSSLEGMKVRTFSTGGKDGAIDHIVNSNSGSLVIECKDLAKYQDATSAWSKVESLLLKNIVSTNGPAKGQPQYSPWFDQLYPINHYKFYVSAQFPNESKIRSLQEKISNFFYDIGSKYHHLSHLKYIKIEVLAWNDLVPLLSFYPHLCLKWFPNYRITGLSLLKKHNNINEGFRLFLNNDTLPYLPSDDIELQPETLLQKLYDKEVTGLIITGVGGVGKTRLVLEVGQLALKQNTTLDLDWLVVQIDAKKCKSESIKKIAERVGQKKRVLFLCDYLEAQKNILDILETINDYNDENYQFSYIANCRYSYYEQLEHLAHHQKVILTNDLCQNTNINKLLPYKNEPSYSEKIVEHILFTSDVSNPETFISVCMGLPVLAVFIVHLHKQGKSEDLNQLREKNDFSDWISKRIRSTFKDSIKELPLNLTLLLSQYPISVDAVNLLRTDNHILWSIHDLLFTDGWIYEDENENYNIVHDVFIDQILFKNINSRLHARQKTDLINQSFTLAASINNVSSVLLAWQRLSDELTNLD